MVQFPARLSQFFANKWSTSYPPHQVSADRKQASAFKSKLSSSLTWQLLRKSGHTIPLLKILQWLSRSFRGKIKALKMVHEALPTGSSHSPSPPSSPTNFPFAHCTPATMACFSSNTPGVLVPQPTDWNALLQHIHSSFYSAFSVFKLNVTFS